MLLNCNVKSKHKNELEMGKGRVYFRAVKCILAVYCMSHFWLQLKERYCLVRTLFLYPFFSYISLEHLWILVLHVNSLCLLIKAAIVTVYRMMFIRMTSIMQTVFRNWHLIQDKLQTLSKHIQNTLDTCVYILCSNILEDIFQNIWPVYAYEKFAISELVKSRLSVFN